MTAGKWLDAHRDSVAEDERHRVVTEDDVAEDVDAARVVDAAYVDIREIAETEPQQAREDVVRVPSAGEVGTSIARARRALAEIAAREEADQAAADEGRAAELARWHHNDQATKRAAANDIEPLERGYAEPSYDRATNP